MIGTDSRATVVATQLASAFAGRHAEVRRLNAFHPLPRLLAANTQDDGFDLLSAAGIPESILPRIIAPQDKVGTVQPQLPEPLGELAGVQHIAAEIASLTGAFYDFAHDSSAENDAALRASTAALDAALAREGTTISDQMAWRSQCAHGCWEAVKPTPDDLPGAKPRPSMPAPVKGEPFWESGCAPFCKG